MTTLEMRNIYKSFGPVDVLQDVSLSIEPGKVHVLLGENGAGKSTLIKMMSGIYQPDRGQILVDGREVTLPDVRAAENLGIATIHQELNLVPSLCVGENLLLGRWPRRGPLLNRAEVKRQAAAALQRIGLDVDLHARVGTLGIATQQLIEIAKALSLDSQVLILDEPTAALTSKEIEVLFSLMRQLRERGVAMVFISHHLDELAEIGDTVSVLRDGNLVAQVPAATKQEELVKLMVGRPIDQQFPPRKVDTGEVLLRVEELTEPGKFTDVSFEVHAGEVLGIAGLVGAGRTEVLRAIAGADPYASGSVQVGGENLKSGDIRGAIKAKIGMVPEDRKAAGLILGASVDENLGYATLHETSRWGFADRKGQTRRSAKVAEKLQIRMGHLGQRIKELSGGNQQKVVFGRWNLAQSQVLLLDEPTRGVDVGAKVEIYELINELVAAGGAVVMVSSELPEVLGMSDRILVMSEGRVAGELPAAESTQQQVMTLAVANVKEELTNKNTQE